jgi:TetR/AcrR family transcriptional regulator, regulator of autoinduction and epiphytic fitness
MAAATDNASRINITPSDTVDGRTARSDRPHNALLDACLRLLDEGNLRPTTEEIAERAAVSVRSVHQHFSERDALLIAACERQCRQASQPTPPIPAASSFDDGLTAVVAQRARIWERVSASRRAMSAREHFSTEIAASAARLWQRERRELLSAFGPELDRLSHADRARVVAALTAAIAWSTWESLRMQQRLSKGEARKVLQHLVASLLPR